MHLKNNIQDLFAIVETISTIEGWVYLPGRFLSLISIIFKAIRSQNNPNSRFAEYTTKGPDVNFLADSEAMSVNELV
jgi:hypothetical protein